MFKVAHVMHSYLGQSETFIWQYLNNFINIFPIVMSQHILNLDQFPLKTGKIIQINGPRFSKPWFMDNWYRRICKLNFGFMESIIIKEKIHLIHAHFGPLGCTYLPVALKLKLPIITSFYGYDLSVNDIIKKRQEDYLKLFEYGTHFLVEGPAMKDKLLYLGCPENKISIQRIAINLENYHFNTRHYNNNNPIRLLYVGRLIEKKGLEYTLRALSKIKTDYSFQLRIIGGGKLENSLKLMASNLGLSKEIVWLKTQPHRQVIKELKSADILIQTSVTANNGDSEGGAPTILLEAQACGLPIISTYHADIPYITKVNETSLLSPERDVDSIGENIRYLFDNPDIWSSMGKKGREIVETNHNVKKEVLFLENFYNNIIRNLI